MNDANLMETILSVMACFKSNAFPLNAIKEALRIIRRVYQIEVINNDRYSTKHHILADEQDIYQFDLDLEYYTLVIPCVINIRITANDKQMSEYLDFLDHFSDSGEGSPDRTVTLEQDGYVGVIGSYVEYTDSIWVIY